MKKIVEICLLSFLLVNSTLLSLHYQSDLKTGERIVKATKKIEIPEFPGAFNPSLIKLNDHYLLTFRYQPAPFFVSWISYIGLVLLDDHFDQIGEAQLLDTRLNFNMIPSQSEDARVFAFEGKLYVVFNDCREIENPGYHERRDMYLAELYIDHHNRFQLGEPLRLIHIANYRNHLWQKNWSPFEWQGNLLFSYTINPHEVLSPNLNNGICINEGTTFLPISWDYGPLRGGTPAQLVDGEYLAFFHSGALASSACSNKHEIWHYFMGAYTFSSEPPFALTSISPRPIDAPGFYSYSHYYKRVIYPGGFVVDGNTLYLAYGKDDSEIWIATMDLEALKKSMVTIHD